MNPISRYWRHLTTGPWALRRHFPEETLRAIEAAVAEFERGQAGELRFAVEAALPLGGLLAGQTARERAIQVFSDLRVWDTEANDGILIYLLLAERDVEIVADRGVAAGTLSSADWEACCQAMEAEFRSGRFREGVIAGIAAIAQVLVPHARAGRRPGQQMPDAPVVV